MSNVPSLQGFASDAEEVERNAYNAAFHALGLRWYWDADTYSELQSIADARERVRMYLRTRQTHLLAAYDADTRVALTTAAGFPTAFGGEMASSVVGVTATS